MAIYVCISPFDRYLCLDVGGLASACFSFFPAVLPCPAVPLVQPIRVASECVSGVAFAKNHVQFGDLQPSISRPQVTALCTLQNPRFVSRG
jgi:hypothetical protein